MADASFKRRKVDTSGSDLQLVPVNHSFPSSSHLSVQPDSAVPKPGGEETLDIIVEELIPYEYSHASGEHLSVEALFKCYNSLKDELAADAELYVLLDDSDRRPFIDQRTVFRKEDKLPSTVQEYIAIMSIHKVFDFIKVYADVKLATSIHVFQQEAILRPYIIESDNTNFIQLGARLYDGAKFSKDRKEDKNPRHQVKNVQNANLNPDMFAFVGLLSVFSPASTSLTNKVSQSMTNFFEMDLVQQLTKLDKTGMNAPKPAKGVKDDNYAKGVQIKSTCRMPVGYYHEKNVDEFGSSVKTRVIDDPTLIDEYPYIIKELDKKLVIPPGVVKEDVIEFVKLLFRAQCFYLLRVASDYGNLASTLVKEYLVSKNISFDVMRPLGIQEIGEDMVTQNIIFRHTTHIVKLSEEPLPMPKSSPLEHIVFRALQAKFKRHTLYKEGKFASTRGNRNLGLTVIQQSLMPVAPFTAFPYAFGLESKVGPSMDTGILMGAPLVQINQDILAAKQQNPQPTMVVVFNKQAGRYQGFYNMLGLAVIAAYEQKMDMGGMKDAFAHIDARAKIVEDEPAVFSTD